MMFTLDGVPLLYNGMEVGDTTESAAPALFERTPIQWEMAERRPQVVPYYQALAALRRAHPALTRGAVRWLRNGDEQRVLSYRARRRRRIARGRGQSVVPALRGHRRGRPRASTRTSRRRCATREARRAASLPAVFLAPWEFRVFRRATP